MITVNVKQLVDAIRESDSYKIPDMNEGVGYLYSNLYERLYEGEDVTLSSLDFDAFEQGDINTLRDLHTNIFELNCHMAGSIMYTLKRVAPVSKAVNYV